MEDRDDLKSPANLYLEGSDQHRGWFHSSLLESVGSRGVAPFEGILTHGFVLDDKGRKMSKSLGNVLDPLDLIDKYGADPLRFTLTAMAVTGRDLKLSETRIEGYRNFVTKIWNAAKYLEMNGCHFDDEFDISSVEAPSNKWMVGKTQDILSSVNQSYERFRFNDIANNLYNHTWGVFCDWYIEFSKSLLNNEDEKTVQETRKTLSWAFVACLKMLHPIMPFVTEELWEHFRKDKGLLSNSNWPTISVNSIDKNQVNKIENVISFIEDIRSTKSDFNLLSGGKTDLFVVDLESKQYSYIKENEKIICKLARLLEIKQVQRKPENALAISGCKVEAFVSVQSDFNLELEKERVNATLKKLEIENIKLSEKLNNKNFRDKAPKTVIKKFESDHEDLKSKLNKQKSLLEGLEKINN